MKDEAGREKTAPCAKVGEGGFPNSRKMASKAILPSATMTFGWMCSISRSRYGWQFAISCGVGLLPGGAQRQTAVM